MDNHERAWDIRPENNETLILIDDEPQYRVISLDNKKLVVATVKSGLIYHFEKQW